MSYIFGVAASMWVSGAMIDIADTERDKQMLRLTSVCFSHGTITMGATK